ncbi:MAG: hypothetical protein RL557_825 [archaeon]|jgi:hypothetical protein
MENDHIKSAFHKVKQDVQFLHEELLKINIFFSDIQESLKRLHYSQQFTNNLLSTLQQIIHTNSANPTQNPTVPMEIKGLKDQNLSISMRNEGVPTDRQTDRPTDKSTNISSANSLKSIEHNLQEATEILSSLDNLKKDIRLKFKHLTHQEMLVFSTIYQLEEQNQQEITYTLLSRLLELSESSIRDYVHRMTNKGIPIKKEKINNKKILLKIAPDLKKIASLSTIIRLREI